MAYDPNAPHPLDSLPAPRAPKGDAPEAEKPSHPLDALPDVRPPSRPSISLEEKTALRENIIAQAGARREDTIAFKAEQAKRSAEEQAAARAARANSTDWAEGPVQKAIALTGKAVDKVDHAVENTPVLREASTIAGNTIGGISDMVGYAATGAEVGFNVSPAAFALRKMGVDTTPKYGKQFGEAAEDIRKALTAEKYDESFLMRDLPSALGTTVPFIASGGLAGLAGASAAASTGMTATLGATMGAGSGYETATEVTNDPVKIVLRTLAGAGLMAMEAIPASRVLRRMNDATGGRFAKSLSKRIGDKVGDALSGAAEEAFQEAVQTMGETAADRYILDIKNSIYDDLKNVGEGAGAGAITGGLITMLFGGAARADMRRTLRQRGRDAEQVAKMSGEQLSAAMSEEFEKDKAEANPPAPEQTATPASPEGTTGSSTAPEPDAGGDFSDQAPELQPDFSGPAKVERVGEDGYRVVDGAEDVEHPVTDRDTALRVARILNTKRYEDGFDADGSQGQDTESQASDAGAGMESGPRPQVPSTQEVEAAVRKFEAGVRRATGNRAIKVQAREDATPEGQQTKGIAASLGYHVTFVERADSPGGLEFPASFDPQNKRHLLVEAGNSRKVGTALVLHEVMHTEKRIAPDEWQEFYTRLKDVAGDTLQAAEDAYARDFDTAGGDFAAKSPEYRAEEGVAKLAELLSQKILDDTVTDEMLVEAASKTPTIIDRLLDSINNMLAKVGIGSGGTRGMKGQEDAAVIEFRDMLAQAKQRFAGEMADLDNLAQPTMEATDAPQQPIPTEPGTNEQDGETPPGMVEPDLGQDNIAPVVGGDSVQNDALPGDGDVRVPTGEDQSNLVPSGREDEIASEVATLEQPDMPDVVEEGDVADAPADVPTVESQAAPEESPVATPAAEVEAAPEAETQSEFETDSEGEPIPGDGSGSAESWTNEYEHYQKYGYAEATTPVRPPAQTAIPGLTPEQQKRRYNREVLSIEFDEELQDYWGSYYGNSEHYSRHPHRFNAITEAKRANKILTPDEARKVVDGWKATALEDGKSGKFGGKTVISLFDRTGIMAKPWHEAGFYVHPFDLNDDEGSSAVNVMNMTVEWLQDNGLEECDILLSQPPCIDFTNASNPSKAAKKADGRLHQSILLVDKLMDLIEYLRPKAWMLENPVGEIANYLPLPEPTLRFNPNNYGHPYTKATNIWGFFNPNTPLANVSPTEGSRMHNLSGSNPKSKLQRSITPEGFAYAWYMANRHYANEFDEFIKDRTRSVWAQENNDHTVRIGWNPDQRAAAKDVFDIEGVTPEIEGYMKHAGARPAGRPGKDGKRRWVVKGSDSLYHFINNVRTNYQWANKEAANHLKALKKDRFTQWKSRLEGVSSHLPSVNSFVNAQGAVDESDPIAVDLSKQENDVWPSLKNGQRVSLKTYRGRGGDTDKYAEGVNVPALGDGEYSALRRGHAESFGPEVEEMILPLNRPAVIQSDEDLARWMGQTEIGLTNDERMEGLKYAREQMEALGYDSVVVNIPQWSDQSVDGGKSVKRTREIFGESQVLRFDPDADPDPRPWTKKYPKLRTAQKKTKQPKESPQAQETQDEQKPNSRATHRVVDTQGNVVSEHIGEAAAKGALSRLGGAGKVEPIPGNQGAKSNETQESGQSVSDDDGRGQASGQTQAEGSGSKNPQGGAKAAKGNRGSQKFSRAATERRLIDLATKSLGLGEISRDAEMVADNAGVEPTFSFAGSIPTEIKTALEGRFHLMSQLKANVQGGKAEDYMSAVGEDAFIAALEQSHGSLLKKAIELAEGAAELEPEAAFHARLLKTWPRTDAGIKTKTLKNPSDELSAGDQVTIHGEKYDVDEDGGAKHLLDADGEFVTYLDALEEMPVDIGGVSRAIDKDLLGRPKPMTSGDTQAMFGEPTPEKTESNLDDMDKARQNESAPKDNETAEMFADAESDDAASFSPFKEMPGVVLEDAVGDEMAVKAIYTTADPDSKYKGVTIVSDVETGKSIGIRKFHDADAAREHFQSLKIGGDSDKFFDVAAADIIRSDEKAIKKNAAMRKLGERYGIDEKEAQEKVEGVLVRLARHAVLQAELNGTRPIDLFDNLVRMYENQPRFSLRSSTQLINQAYSTPIPLAWAASYMIGVRPGSTVYEPTAGHGALLIEAEPSNTQVNEIDEDRLATLEETAFQSVTRNDASNYTPDRKFDRILANPPFGGLEKPYYHDGYKLSKLEHQISAKALDAMKDDGRAVFILGAGMKPGQVSAGEKIFMNLLYNQYNVIANFEVSGKLYKNQGAAWPVRVIAVDGRKADYKSQKPRKLAPSEVKHLTSWDDLYNEIRKVRDGLQEGRDNLVSDDGRRSGGGTKSGVRGGSSSRPQGETTGDSGLVFPPETNDPATSSGGSNGGNTGGSKGTHGSHSGKGGSGVLSDQRSGQPGLSGKPDAGEHDGLGLRDGMGEQGKGDVSGGRPPQGNTQGNTPAEGRPDKVASNDGATGDNPSNVPTGINAPKKPRKKKKRKSLLETNADMLSPEEREATQKALDELKKKFGGPKQKKPGEDDVPFAVRPGEDSESLLQAMQVASALVKVGATSFSDLVAEMREILPNIKAELLQSAYMSAIPLAGDKAAEMDNPVTVLQYSAADIDAMEYEEQYDDDDAPADDQQEEEDSEPAQDDDPLPEWEGEDRKYPEPESISDFQNKYRSRSDGKSLDAVTPKYLDAETTKALTLLERKYGHIDDFVARELQYDSREELYKAFSSEQIDGVALALAQYKSGDALVIGDQTGMGKGRQAAGMIRYAKKNGMTPVFLTQGPKLFSDMYRDTLDIGDTMAPFIMAGETSKGHIKDQDNNTVYRAITPARQKSVMMKYIAGDEMALEDYDSVFLTYSQISLAHDHKQRFLEQLAKRRDIFLIMDESHEGAGKESTTGNYLRGGVVEKKVKGVPGLVPYEFEGLLNMPGLKGVVYLSATYAKRPDSMPLYFKTGLRNAVKSVDSLIDIMSIGGVALQQYVANVLAKAGQYIRREQDFAGVKFTVSERLPTGVSHAQLVSRVDGVSEALRAIVNYSEVVKESAGLQGLQSTAQTGSRMSVHSFSSSVHNYTRSLLLSAKVESAVEEAIEAFKNGEKPVLTLVETKGDFFADYAQENDIRPGENIDVSFYDLLMRALDGTMTVTEKDAQGGTTKFQASPDLLGTRDEYEEVKAIIKSLDNSLPISPIDYMHARMREAGMRSVEVTGRMHAVKYHLKEGRQTYERRSQKEINDKNAPVNDFNNGRADAIILNSAGSTGLSLHASKKLAPENQQPRRMIVVQPSLDINVFMQTLGRIFRTGMVEGGASYSLMTLPVAAERRPSAVLGSKMKSLNANTTADSDSGAGFDAPDIFNKEGDKIATLLLAEDDVLSRTVGMSADVTLTGQINVAPDTARKLAGRMAILSNEQQEQIYDTFFALYDSHIAMLKETGEYDLDMKVDEKADAEPKGEPQVLLDGTDESDPFQASSMIQTYGIKDNRKPPTREEVERRMAEGIGKDAAAWESHINELDSAAAYGARVWVDSQPAHNEIGKQKKERRRDAAQIGSQVVRAKIDTDILPNLGKLINIDTGKGTSIGVITNITGPSKARSGKGNPWRASSWRVEIATADPTGRLRYPLSVIGPDNINLTPAVFDGLDVFDDVQKEEFRDDRTIITGNVLGAMEIVRSGQVFAFRTKDGEFKTGLLMPRSWDQDAIESDPRKAFTHPQAIRKYLDFAPFDLNRYVTDGGELTIRSKGGGEYELAAPKAVRRGGLYHKNKDLKDITGNWLGRGQMMKVTVDRATLDLALDHIVSEMNKQLIPTTGDIEDVERLNNRAETESAPKWTALGGDVKKLAGSQGKSDPSPEPDAPTTKGEGEKAYTVHEHTHTQSGEKRWVVVPNKYLGDDFAAIRGKAKRYGGFYQKKWGTTPAGFAFPTEAEANKFAEETFVGDDLRFAVLSRPRAYTDIGHNESNNVELWWIEKGKIRKKKPGMVNVDYASVPLQEAHEDSPALAKSPLAGRIDHTTKQISLRPTHGKKVTQRTADLIANKLSKSFPKYEVETFGVDEMMFAAKPSKWDTWTGKTTTKTPAASNSQDTQRTNTTRTYVKAAALLRRLHPKGKILDYGAGKGLGSKEIRADSFEPFPESGFTPTFSSAEEIKDGSYNKIINPSVLNVVPRDIRDDIVQNIGRILTPGGFAIVTARDFREVQKPTHKIKYTPDQNAWVVGEKKGEQTFQKGFVTGELVSYLQEVLGDGFVVKNANAKSVRGNAEEISGHAALIEKLRDADTDDTKFAVKPQARWTKKRVNNLLQRYAYEHEDKTKAYAGHMDPEDFLAVSTPAGYVQEIKDESSDLDVERLAKEGQPMFLMVREEEDFRGNTRLRVTGHEGRHRAAAMIKAGIKRIPVVIQHASAEERKFIDMEFLLGQRFSSTERGESHKAVRDLTPISYAEYDNLVERFVDGRGDVGLRNSLREQGEDAEARFFEKFDTDIDNENDIQFAVAPPVDSSAFKKWFGKSKVVGKDGKPLVVYHGTNAVFHRFIPSGLGSFFTPDASAAGTYAGSHRSGKSAVMPTYLSIQNPWTYVSYGDNVPFSEMEDQSRDALESKGYDGVLIPGKDGKPDAWVAFRPNQIKSATGNNGQFGPDNDDIRFAAAAYHGTPFDFDRFTTQHIGSGEGAQAFGWGLYFASAKRVAEWYRDKLTKQHNKKSNPVREMKYKGVEILSLLVDSDNSHEHRQIVGDDREMLHGVLTQFYNYTQYQVDDSIKNQAEFKRVVKQLHGMFREYEDAVARPLKEYFGEDGGRPSTDYWRLALVADWRHTDESKFTRYDGYRIRGLEREWEDALRYAKEVKGESAPEVIKKLRGFHEDTQRLIVAAKASGRAQPWQMAIGELGSLSLYSWMIDNIEHLDVPDLKAFPGRLYHVTLAPDEDEYLHLDEFLEDQPQRIQDALKRIPDDTRAAIEAEVRRVYGPHEWDSLSGQMLVKALEKTTVAKTFNPQTNIWESPRDASLFLRSLGIRGNKFLDGNSRRDAAKLHHNYVIFDEDDVNIDMKFAARDEKIGGDFADISRTLKDRFLTKVQDYLLPMKRTQEAIVKSGGRVTEDSDVHSVEERFYGRAEARSKTFRKNYSQPISKLIAAAGVKTEDIDRYLIARHAGERNDFIEMRNRGGVKPENDLYNPDGEPINHSGMTTEEADDILKEYHAGEHAKTLRAIGRLVDKMNQHSLRQRYEGGLITEQEYHDWSARFKHYVPLRTDMEPDGYHNTKPGKGASVGGREFKSAMGRKSMADTPLFFSYAQFEEGIVRAEKAKIGRAFMTLVEDNPNDKLWEIDKVVHKKTMGRDGKVTTVATGDTRDENHVFRVKVQGIEHRITIHDKALARSLSKLGMAQANTIITYMSKVTRALSAINTQYVPEFIVTNFARDLQTAAINLSIDQSKKMAAVVVKNAPAAARGVWKSVREGEANYWSRQYERLERAGGTVGHFYPMSLQEHKNSLEAEIASLTGERRLHKPRKAFEAAAKTVSDLNTAAENAARLSAFDAALKRGMNEKQAASLAKNLTVNFNRKGELGTSINALYMFYNAGVQGNVRMLQSIGTKKGMKYAAAIASMAAMSDIVNYLLSGEDDDGENFYDAIPEFEKNYNLILVNPLATNEYMKIPLPYGYNVIHATGRQFADAMRSELFGKGDKDITEATVSLAKTGIDAFNPLGGESSFFQVLSPTLLDPFTQINENANFAGQRIMPSKNPFTPEVPDSQRAFPHTGAHYKKLAEGLNAATGGDHVTPGAVDISPESIEHVVEFAGGGLARFVDRSLGTTVDLATGQERHVKDIPFARRIYGSPSPYRHSQRFGENQRAINVALRRAKSYKEGGDHEKAKRVMSELGLTPGRIEKMKKWGKQAKQIKEKINAAKTPKTREALEKRLEELHVRANKTYRGYSPNRSGS